MGKWHIFENQKHDGETINSKRGGRVGQIKTDICVYAERQMVFYNWSSMAPGKEVERQRRITPS